MKRQFQIPLSLVLLTLGLALSGLLIGCQQSRGPSGPAEVDSPPSIGDVHTEVLVEIYAELGRARAAKGQLDEPAKAAAIIAAVNAVSDRHASARLSPETIHEHVEWGRRMAQQDVLAGVADLLTPTELEWWDRFSYEAELSDAREVYLRHCQHYGTPDPESSLGQFLAVCLSSADFWWRYRGEQVPIYRNPYLPLPKPSWKDRVLRFSVGVVVDGVAGGLAGAGGGGPVGAGIVGGLASHGADSILFGD